MARRRKSGGSAGTIIAIAIIAVIGIAGGLFLMQRGKDPFTGITVLDVSEYMRNGNSLRGNEYQFIGTVHERLDEDWGTDEGKLYAIEVTANGSTEFVSILFPPEFNGNDIQRNQEYRFLILVGDGGTLVARDLQKT